MGVSFRSFGPISSYFGLQHILVWYLGKLTRLQMKSKMKRSKELNYSPVYEKFVAFRIAKFNLSIYSGRVGSSIHHQHNNRLL